MKKLAISLLVIFFCLGAKNALAQDEFADIMGQLNFLYEYDNYDAGNDHEMFFKAFCENAPRNGNQVIDTIFYLDKYYPDPYKKIYFNNINEINQYDSMRIMVYPATGAYLSDSVFWDYDSLGRKTAFMYYNSSSQFLYGVQYEYANNHLKKIQSSFNSSTTFTDGYKEFYYSGSRLDSTLSLYIDSTLMQRSHYFWSGPLLDSSISVFPTKPGDFIKNIYSYNSSGLMLKDSLTTDRFNLVVIKSRNYLYNANGSLDSAFLRYTRPSSNILDTLYIALKMHYNPLGNYDSISTRIVVPFTTPYPIRENIYRFSYAPSTFNVDEYEISTDYAYPNPINPGGVIRFTEIPKTFELYDLQGRLVLESKTSEQSVQLPTTIQCGLYLLKIQFSNSRKQVVQKLLISN